MQLIILWLSKLFSYSLTVDGGRHQRNLPVMIALIACLLSNVAFAGHEVIMLIDTSGSMQKNDPLNLRKPALRLAAQMIPTGSKAGIWLFDAENQQVMAFGEVDADWKAKTVRNLDQVHSKGQLTNIEDAITESMRAFSADAQSKSIILLTDGQVDISKIPGLNQASRQRILQDLLPKMSQSNIQIHTIALSENADQDLLQRLAIGSNGTYALTQSAEELTNTFLQAFDQSIAADQVPLEGNRFEVDSNIQEFTALVFRKTGSPTSRLVSPSQKILSKAQPEQSTWYTDSKYDLITVKAPESGTWTLEADLDPDNRVTIVSDLELTLKGLPNNIIAGQTVNLEFYLADGQDPISTPSLLSLLEISFQQTVLADPPKVMTATVSSHNRNQVRTPIDGIFRAKLSKTLVNGEHEFKVLVDGKTFKRSETKKTRVFAQVLESSVALNAQTDSTSYFVNYVPIQGLVDPNSLEVKGSIKTPSGDIKIVMLEKTNFGTYIMQVPATEGDAVYKAFIAVEGKTTAGDAFHLTQGPVNVDYTATVNANIQQPSDLFADMSNIGNQEEQKQVQDIIVKTMQHEKLAQIPDEMVVATKKETIPQVKINDVNTASNQASSFSRYSIFVLIGVALVNVVLLGTIAFFTKRWLVKNKAKADNEDQALIDDINKAKALAHTKAVETKPVENPPPSDEPEHDDQLALEAAKISDMLDSIDDTDETG